MTQILIENLENVNASELLNIESPYNQFLIAIKALASKLNLFPSTVTELAREYNCSRPTVYSIRDSVVKKLENSIKDAQKHLTDGKPIHVVELDEQRLERAVISFYIESPSSIRAVRRNIKAAFDIDVSYGKIQRILKEAEKKAEDLNRSVVLNTIFNVSLDEMFSQTSVVLAGTDLDTQYIFLLKKSDGRKGEHWTEALNECIENQNFNPEMIIKDAGTGLQKGCSESLPNAGLRDDLFHVRLFLTKVSYWLERSAYRMIRKEQQLENDLKMKKNEHRKKELKTELEKHTEKMKKKIEVFDAFENLEKQTIKYLDIINPETATIMSGDECRKKLISIGKKMKNLKVKQIGRFAGYLVKRAPGVTLWIDEVKKKLDKLKQTCIQTINLASLYENASSKVKDIFTGLFPKMNTNKNRSLVDFICLFWKICYEQNKCSVYRKKQELSKQFGVVISILSPFLKDNHYNLEILRKVFQIMNNRYRASSLVEALNSWLRPHLYFHKGVTQDFLSLFACHRNLKKPGNGKNKGLSPYEKVTGNYFNDWLTVLGYPLKK